MRHHPGIWLVVSLVTVALGLGVFSVLHHCHEDEFTSCHFCLLVSHGAPLPIAGAQPAEMEPSAPVVPLVAAEFAASPAEFRRTRAPPRSLPS